MEDIIYSALTSWAILFLILALVLKPAVGFVLGPVASQVMFWLSVIGSIGLKIYLKKKTGRCLSRKRLIGKTAIITGANSGIGKETTFALANRGCKIIMACRDVEKAKKVRDEIARSTTNKKIEVQHLDLASLASVRKFANNIIDTEKKVDILINNAGATGLGNKRTDDNLQIGMQVNHFGPFLLTCLLVGKMKKSAPSRIIMVSSYLHHCAKFNIDNLNCEKKFNESQVHFCSKLANIMIASELAKKLEGTGVTVNCVHPGLVYTRTWRYLPSAIQPILKYILTMFFKTETEAAQTTIYAASDKDLEDVTGKFFCDCQAIKPSYKALKEDLAKKVWEKSEVLVGLKPEERDF